MNGEAERPARLLFVITTSDFGGSESFLERLVTGLDRTRFELMVCSLCPPGRIGARIEASGVPVLSLDMDAKARPWQMLRAVPRLARLFDHLEIDLVQGLLYRANVLAALARRVSRRKPRLVTGQRSLIPAGRGLDFAAQRWTRSWADRVVAVSEAVRKELLATENIDPERVVVIQNGIDLERFAPPSASSGTPGSQRPAPEDERATARAAWQLPAGDSIVVGAVGRLHGPKGVAHLVDALAMARVEDPRLVLVLAGDGPERAALEQRVATLELEEFVRFLGYQADPSPLFPGFDIYCLPSLAEGSPNALLEAMGRGRACVASKVGGVPEAAVDGESALLVPPADPRALARALLRLARDARLRTRLGQAARERVESRFDLRRMIEAHASLYDGLLRNER